ncbi:MAG: DUF1963 domain-containing protein [Sulfitobacter sp.]
MHEHQKNLVAPAIEFYPLDAGVEPPGSALRIGGTPTLDEGLEWPRFRSGDLMHFVCQIDLGSLPQQARHHGKDYDFLPFPQQGTLFVFVPLDGDYTANFEDFVEILYSPKSVAELRPSKLPTDIPKLDEDAYDVDLSMTSPCRKMLLPMATGMRTQMTHRHENPLIPEDRTNLTEQDRYQFDLEYAALLADVGIDFQVRAPKPAPSDAVNDPLYPDFAWCLQDALRSGEFDWTWQHIFDAAQEALMGCLQTLTWVIPLELEEGKNTSALKKLLAQTEKSIAHLSVSRLDDPPTIVERLLPLQIPSHSPPTDVQLKAWMLFARRSKGAAMSPEVKRAFSAMLQKTEDAKENRDPADLKIYGFWGGHPDLSAWHLHSTCSTALKGRPDPEKDAQNTEVTPPKPEATPQAIAFLQLFGIGPKVHRPQLDPEKHVQLLKFSVISGLHFETEVVQVWIEKENLAKGNFDGVLTTRY